MSLVDGSRIVKRAYSFVPPAVRRSGGVRGRPRLTSPHLQRGRLALRVEDALDKDRERPAVPQAAPR